MRPPGIVVFNPLLHAASEMLERAELFEPHALFFQASEETFDHSVLLGRIRGDELLAESIGVSVQAKVSC